MRAFVDSYLARGWVTIPVGHREKRPMFDGWSETTLAQAQASVDRDFPEDKRTNVGVALGQPSQGLVDIDLDSVEANELADLFLPPTLTFGRSSTPKSHRLYLCSAAESKRYQDPMQVKGPDGKPFKRTLLEIRSTGGQTVFPPSTHVSGEAIAFHGPWVEPVALEAAVLSAATDKLAAVCLLARYWPAGGRHDAQLALAGALLSDGWSEDETIEILCGVCRLAGDEDRPKREATVRSTADRLRAGEGVTGWKQLAEHIERKVFNRVRSWLSVQVDPSQFESISPATDVANARRLVQYFGQDIRFIRTWGKWVTWDGMRWSDGEHVIYQFAIKTVEKIYEEAEAAEKAGNKEYAKFLRAWGKASSSASALANMVRVARSMSEVSISHEALDVNPLRINVRNGTFELDTGLLREHRREDLITKLCMYDYDPNAQCPTWERSVLEMMDGDVDLADYLRLSLGYALSGTVTEEKLFILYGQGENGKSKFIKRIQDIFGDDYQVQLDTQVLMSKEGSASEHPTGRASLFGKRLAVAVESDSGKRLAEGMVKALTGGDLVTARRMREDYWQFSPTHTIFLITNNKPVIRGGDHGIWRRIIVIPFLVSFAGRADKTLPAKWRAESTGILRWLLEAAMAYVQAPDLLNIVPDKANLATAEYREEQDRLAEFLEKSCWKDPSYRVEFSSLYRAYEAWAKDEGEQPVSRRAFGSMLEERGYISVRDSSTRYRTGLMLTPQAEAAANARRF